MGGSFEEAEAAKREEEEEATRRKLLKVLEALKQELPESNSAIKALLDLGIQSDSVVSKDPYLTSICNHLSELNSLLDDHSLHDHGIKSFLTRRIRSHEIGQLANSIESEIQGWIDRRTVLNLAKTVADIRKSVNSPSESVGELLSEKMDEFITRVSKGFNMELQDLLLKSGVFSELEWVLCKSQFPKTVRERAAVAIKELVLFNKDVFVGQVLVGQTVKALISMGSLSSLQVLCSLIKAIKSPLVDEIESAGGISKIVSHFGSDDLGIKIRAMDCVLEIGYFGRKEAVEALLNAGLIKRLVDLQRSELGGDLIDLGRRRRGKSEEMKSHPFASIVARFAVQCEVGEGLRQREKRALKQEILKRVREACVSDAEAATIIAEVLWGSSP